MLVGEKRHQRRTHLAHQRTNAVLASDVLHVDHDHLDGTQHHCSVAVVQTSLDSLDDCLGLTLIARFVASQAVQDVHLAPLGALGQSHHQLLQHGGGDLQHLARRVVLDLAQRSDRIRHHSGILVRNHVVQRVDEALLLHQGRTHIVQLANTHSSGLTHVGILCHNTTKHKQGQKCSYAEALSGIQRYVPHECNPWYAQQEHGSTDSGQKHPTHYTDAERSYTDERLHSEKSQIGLLISIVNEVQITQFPHLNVSLLHTVNHINEQFRHILLNCHEGNNLL